MQPRLFVILLMCVVMFAAGGAAAQADGAQVRVAAYFYSDMDVFVDGDLVSEHLGFPFVSEYLDLPAGAHTLVAAPAGEGIEAGAQHDLDLSAGHSYLVAAAGIWDEDDAPTLLSVDETENLAGLDQDTSHAIFLHLVSGAPEVDVYVDAERSAGAVAYGEAVFLSVPVGPFEARLTVAGAPDSVVYEDTFFGVPQALTVAAALGSSPDEMFLVTHTRSAATITEYLAALSRPDYEFELATLYAALETAGLADDLAGEGMFTLFAPQNDAFQALPADEFEALQADPEALADVLSYHVVAGLIPPYELPAHNTLTTLHGGTLTLEFPEGELWTINGDVPIYSDTRVGNGIIYQIGGVLLPESND